jgi:arsenical pump membrane protein
MEAAPTAIAILIITLYLVICQPHKLGIGWSALAGAVLALGTGVVSWKDISEAWSLVGNSTLTLVAMMMLALVLDEAGFFRELALYLTRLGLGIGRFFFLLLVLTGALLTAVFTNQGTTLIWTPIILEILLVLRFSPRAALACLISTSFIVDAASLALPTSNLVNLITINYFNISFLRYTLVMVPITGIAIASSFAVTWFYFKRYIPPHYTLTYLDNSIPVISDPFVYRCSLVILGLLLISYTFAKPLGIPIAVIAILGILILLALAGRWFQKRPHIISISKVLQQTPWQMILFSLGMSVVVIGIQNTNLTPLFSHILEPLSSWGLTVATTGSGFLAMLLASCLNNLPTTLLEALAIQNTININPNLREAMIYANIIGCDLGAKLTPIGSLSTLLWLEILSRQKLKLTTGQYIRIHLALTIPVLFITLLSLAIWLPWLIA